MCSDDITAGLLPVLEPELPDELKVLDQWCVWSPTRSEGSARLEKIPRTPGTRTKASTNKPSTWGTFPQAIADVRAGKAFGAGFVDTPDDPYLFIDSDGCIVDGKPDARARAIIALFPYAYVELSPSGTGLRIIVRGVRPPGTWRDRRDGIECYREAHFFTLTGHIIEGRETIGDADPDKLLTFFTRYLSEPTRKAGKAASPLGSTPAGTLPDDDTILETMFASRNGATIRAIWEGDNPTGDGSDSSGDLALMNHLRPYCCGDPVVMERLSTRSPRGQRDKWQRADYRERTIAKALEDWDGKSFDWAKAATGGGTARLTRRSPASPHPGVDGDGDGPETGDQHADDLDILAPGLAIQNGMFVAFREMADGLRIVPLSNFTARITRDVIRDDGAETHRRFTIEAIHKSGDIQTVDVPSGDFASLAWVPRELGPRRIVAAGATTAGKVREAIQHLSERDGVTEERIFAHTGGRELGGRWGYLSASGWLGPDGLDQSVTTELPGRLARYALPEPVTGAALQADARAHLRMLELAPPRIAGPLVALIPAAILSELHAVDFVPHLHGRTGVHKTAAAAVVTQHFGPSLDARSATSAHSTINALERTAFAAKDAVLLIDDLAPDGSAAEQAKMRGSIQRLARNVGNGANRGRMHADGTMRPDLPPRGVSLTTGEDTAGGHSATARMLLLEVNPGDIRLDVLTELQAAAADGALARVTASVIQFIAANREMVTAAYTRAVAEETARFRTLTLAHARYPDMLATLVAASGVWLDALLALKAITTEEAAAARNTIRQGIEAAGAAQAEGIGEVDPVAQFIRLVGAAIAAGSAHLASPDDNGPPANAPSCGWTVRMISTRGDLVPDPQPKGPRIGWIDAEGVYLLPDVALDAAQALGRSQGVAIPWASKRLGKRLQEAGHLRSTESPDRNTRKLTVAGTRVRVWHLAREAVIPLAEPETAGPSTEKVTDIRERQREPLAPTGTDPEVQVF